MNGEPNNGYRVGHGLKVGSLVYATEQGIGILARDFCRHGVITDPFVVEHSRHPTHHEWYPGSPALPIRSVAMGVPAVRDWLSTLDIFLAVESPYHWPLFDYCRQAGIKTALLTMYECTPARLPARPDLFLCPSPLDQDYFPDSSILVQVPVEVPWRMRREAKVFVHNAGHGSFRDRNGTRKLNEAVSCYVKSPATFLVRSQSPGLWDLPKPGIYRRANGITVDYRLETASYETLWDEGDVFLFPESFNGLSLPLQESYAAGMLVMATDRYPANTWLPNGPLVSKRGTRRASIGGPYNEFDEAVIESADIAAKVDEWYGRDISAYSEQGRAWATENSWEALGPKWYGLLTDLKEGRLP